MGVERRTGAPSFWTMGSYLQSAWHDGSLWVVGSCIVLFVGVVVGLYARSGMAINSHPYEKPADGGELAADLPAEATGREEFETMLLPRRPRHRDPE